MADTLRYQELVSIHPYISQVKKLKHALLKHHIALDDQLKNADARVDELKAKLSELEAENLNRVTQTFNPSPTGSWVLTLEETERKRDALLLEIEQKLAIADQKKLTQQTIIDVFKQAGHYKSRRDPILQKLQHNLNIFTGNLQKNMASNDWRFDPDSPVQKSLQFLYFAEYLSNLSLKIEEIRELRNSLVPYLTLIDLLQDNGIKIGILQEGDLNYAEAAVHTVAKQHLAKIKIEEYFDETERYILALAQEETQSRTLKNSSPELEYISRKDEITRTILLFNTQTPTTVRDLLYVLHPPTKDLRSPNMQSPTSCYETATSLYN